MFRKATCALLGTALSTPLLLDSSEPKKQARHAICILYPNKSNTRGIVAFSQQNLNGPTKIACTVKGLTPNAKHGFHVHQYGDLTDGCATTCEHFNPQNKNHGGPKDKERHIGDLGNISADGSGNAYYAFKDDRISLFGEFSILGRAIVVHSGEDDLGKGNNQQSLKTGNSGGRIACGVIGLAKEFKDVPLNDK